MFAKTGRRKRLMRTRSSGDIRRVIPLQVRLQEAPARQTTHLLLLQYLQRQQRRKRVAVRIKCIGRGIEWRHKICGCDHYHEMRRPPTPRPTNLFTGGRWPPTPLLGTAKELLGTWPIRVAAASKLTSAAALLISSIAGFF